MGGKEGGEPPRSCGTVGSTRTRGSATQRQAPPKHEEAARKMRKRARGEDDEGDEGKGDDEEDDVDEDEDEDDEGAGEE
eukprot:2140051-Pyramimonas_sp.AAC.1